MLVVRKLTKASFRRGETGESGNNVISATSFEGIKYFTASVISTDDKIVYCVCLKMSPKQFSVKSTVYRYGLTTLHSFSVPRHDWCKLLSSNCYKQP